MPAVKYKDIYRNNQLTSYCYDQGHIFRSANIQQKKNTYEVTLMFTLLVLVHSLLTMPSFIVHYMPPYVDPSYSPVASHGTLFL